MPGRSKTSCACVLYKVWRTARAPTRLHHVAGTQQLLLSQEGGVVEVGEVGCTGGEGVKAAVGSQREAAAEAEGLQCTCARQAGEQAGGRTS